MKVNWFKNPNNIEYTNIHDFVSIFAKLTGIPDLEGQIRLFWETPKKSGKVLRGQKNITVRLFIPKLTFEERFEQDESVWVYLGKGYPCYCLYGMEPWWDKNYFFFQHKQCEYFPCHKTVKKEDFNCLFCYCPLYPLKECCGGNFAYYGKIKDCSSCTLPHQKRNYGYITSRFNEIAAAEIK